MHSGTKQHGWEPKSFSLPFFQLYFIQLHMLGCEGAAIQRMCPAWITPSIANEKTSQRPFLWNHSTSVIFFYVFFKQFFSLFVISSYAFGPSFFLFSYFHVMWLPSWRWFIWTIPLSLWESRHHLDGMAYFLRHIQTWENESTPKQKRRASSHWVT